MEQPPPARRDAPTPVTPVTPVTSHEHQPDLLPYISAPIVGLALYGVREPVAAGLSSGVAFLAGAWLALAPFALQ